MPKQPKKQAVKKKRIGLGRRLFPNISRRLYASKLIKDVFKAEFGKKLATVTLYGSVAVGKAKARSDIDLNIFVEGWARLPDQRKHDAFWRLRGKIDKMTNEGGYRVDFSIHDSAGPIPAKGDKKIFG